MVLLARVPNGEQFREVRSLGRSVYILEPKHGASYERSIELLKQNGLRPLTYQEALLHLMKDQVLRQRLRSRWFYLLGRLTEKDGVFTIDSKGELANLPDKKLPDEEEVLVHRGDKPISIAVFLGIYVVRWFTLYGYKWTDLPATVVVGVKA